MSADENKALIQRVYTEGFNKGILAVVDEVFAPHFVDHSTPDQTPGIDGVKVVLAQKNVLFKLED